MHEDAVRRLRGALAEAWDSGGRRFVTVEDTTDDSRFVQYVDGQLNVSWPLDSDPAGELSRRGIQLPGSAFVVTWRAGETALLAIGDLLRDEVAALIEDLVDDVLDAGDVAVRIEDDR